MATRVRLEAVETNTDQYATHAFQAALARWNRQRLEPAFPSSDWRGSIERDRHMQLLEGAFVENLRESVLDRAAGAPEDADGFIAWFEDLQLSGPGQNDPLFPWLAEEATVEELSWFLEQEAAGEAGFEDLTALTQIKFPTRPKLELARNYWDEMGRGNPKGMHGPLLDTLVETLGLEPEIATTCWESLALANAMTAMATSRRFAFHSVGALGVIELTAPARSAATAAGLKRLGFTGRERHYFDLHAVLDVRHSEEWNKEVLRPLVEEDPRRARPMAEGALIRLACGARCYEAYRAKLWG
jgi:hypothetical protein